MMRRYAGWVALTAALTMSGPAGAQQTDAAAPQDEESLKIYFDTGSARVGADQQATLDQAARLFREGSPIVMIVSGVADTVGAPEPNLQLSINRAQTVVDGLVARGIPADRLQVLGQGNSDLPVETPDGVPERENRIAEITWR